jgi:hypothetical protein
VRERREGESSRGGGGLLQGCARGYRKARVWGHGPLVGRLGSFSFFFFFFQFRNSFLKNSKNHKKLPKIFINGVLDFRLIITIFF